MQTVMDFLNERFSAMLFDPAHTLDDAEVSTLIDGATRAPSSYNMQNWRFVAVRSAPAKARLRALAADQAKVTEAAVTFIVVGQLPDANVIPDRFAPLIADGSIPAKVAESLAAGAAGLYADPQMARDEAIRSASLSASFLMMAAAGLGFASGPMIGFDAAGVVRAFGLADGEVPAMLVAVGRAAPGNWPQKPRRPIGDVLRIV